jgi:hypothetical protein
MVMNFKKKLYFNKRIRDILGPCTFDSTLCKNEGQCIDEPTIEKGFKCVCSNQFQGEYCEKGKKIYVIDYYVMNFSYSYQSGRNN